MKKIIFMACAVLLVACDKPGKSADKSAATPPVAAAPAAVKHQPTKVGYEGPFGLDMGIPISVLRDDLGYATVSQELQNFYKGVPPRPVTGFTGYFAIATASKGVCRVGARSDVDVVNGSGDQLKAATDKIAEMVELKYGKPTKKYDFSKQDVYVRNPEYWMMGLKEDSVFYLYDWKSSNAHQLPSNITGIEVVANATSSHQGYVDIKYTFSNFDDCTLEIKKQNSSNL